ncbi:GNAT family N-acetyltransferase [Nocardioides sp. Kera G14]|uniref:GNAT family N-acetyltransferase n=1 Tax=Nocardioides sp. Kera G14 TaxID=2884264 RepID=UPI001D106345|nr:GNAT family protein [Nocardioides sp. Kera G14]UDY22726.1 GNAT family N-acetyltransferase [Nocardioides sp. Kera G14]
MPVNEFGQPVGEVVEGWEPRTVAERVTLTGRHVALKPLSSAQFAELYAATCGPDEAPLWTWLPAEMPRNLQEFWMLLAGNVDAYPTTYAVAPSGQKPAGFLSLLNDVPAHGSIEVGWICFGRALRRTAAATEAIHLLQSYVFDELGYRRFEWKCNSLNEPSRRAAARFGFTFEGTFRNAQVVKGRNRDTDWFSITDAEWPTLRERNERWLDPANFDAAGGQLTPLNPTT